ncbi:MAG: prephenate dehydrogenase/arogenate dehydrogenase family protein [Candidatus Lokiarchaeota archaeon]|nr:prephenate dehydrogenase/arogenate dehydrogenase family protein [Candidatus Lokiarchaeota archaeon]
MLGKNFTIIGGSGGMGRVFGKYFKQHGFDITLFARDEKKLKIVAKDLGVKFELDLKKSVENADIVMVSVPIHSTSKMIKKITPLMKKNSLIFDITSLKQGVYKIFSEVHKNYPINCLSIHPMFGPGIKNMKNYVILVLKIGGTEQYDEIINEFINIFRSDEFIIVETTPNTHDSRIALTLGVPHMFNILFLNLLKRTKEPLNELTRFTGTTFLLQKVLAESIIQSEMEMFGEIQIENAEFHEILDIFEDLIKEYKNTIKNKDLKGFTKLFSEALEYSKEDKHFKNSYEYFYEFMKILKEKK